MAPTTAAASRPETGKFSIGQVLERLQDDFGDLTPSKLRFLEEQGLVSPERTKSGYRKFSQLDIERLRLILTLQREHYLPLKVIADVLDDMDAGRDPIIPGASNRSASSILAPRRLLSREELQRMTGATPKFIAEAIAAGVLPAAEVFPYETVSELSALLQLAELGLTPRHLRSMRVAAERDAELVGQALEARGVKGVSPDGRERSLELVDLLETVRRGVLRRRLGR